MNIKSVLAGIVMCALGASSFLPSTLIGQVRQQHLYIDDGFGSFSILTGASGGGTFTFPVGGGLVLTSSSSSSITSLGTITSGMWNGTAIAPAYGGTGLGTMPKDGQLLIGQTSTNGYVLTTLTQGSGISITSGPGTITIAATGGGGSDFSSIAAGTNENALLIGGGGSLGTTGGGTITATTAANVTGLVLGVNGGTGVANSGKTITLGGNVTTSGAYDLTLTLSNTTGVTLPSSGTLIANPMTTLGDMMYGGSSPAGTPTQLSGNTSSRKEFLRSTGASSAATAPVWDTIATGDMPVFGKSGTTHTVGAVPDPGSTAGATRYLREDATWAAPTSSSTALMISGITPVNFNNNSNIPEYWYPLGQSVMNTTPSLFNNNVMMVDRTGTIKNFTVTLTAVPTGTGTATFTILDNTSPSSTQVTVTFNSSSATTLTDNTHTLSIVAGDLISIQTSTTHTGFQSGTNGAWAFDIQ